MKAFSHQKFKFIYSFIGFDLQISFNSFLFLCRLLQLMKDSPTKVDNIGVKVRTANDNVQSIKQLRKVRTKKTDQCNYKRLIDVHLFT